MILQEKGDSDNTIESTVCQEILKCFQCITGSDKGSLRWLMEWTVQSIKHLPGGTEVLGSCFLFVFFFLVATHGQIQNLVAFYQSYSHHLERCYPLSSFSSTAFCVFECIFHLVVSLDPEFGVHDQKVSIQEFPRITQKGQNRVTGKRRVGVKARLGLRLALGLGLGLTRVINISFPSLHDQDAEMRIFTVYWRRKQTEVNVFFHWFAYIGPSKRLVKIVKTFERMRFANLLLYLIKKKSDVLTAVTVVVC